MPLLLETTRMIIMDRIHDVVHSIAQKVNKKTEMWIRLKPSFCVAVGVVMTVVYLEKIKYIRPPIKHTAPIIEQKPEPREGSGRISYAGWIRVLLTLVTKRIPTKNPIISKA